MTKLKQLVKKIVIALLWLETRLILLKYQPKIVGITGSVGKTSTKDALAAVLAQVHQVRASAKSYNSDFGIPLVATQRILKRRLSGSLAKRSRGAWPIQRNRKRSTGSNPCRKITWRRFATSLPGSARETSSKS